MKKRILISIVMFLLSGCARVDANSITTATKAIQGHWNDSKDECEIYVSDSKITWKNKNDGIVYDTMDYTILSHSENTDSDWEVVFKYIDEKDVDKKTQYMKLKLNDSYDNLTMQDEVYDDDGKLTDTADDGTTFDYLDSSTNP